MQDSNTVSIGGAVRSAGLVSLLYRERKSHKFTLRVQLTGYVPGVDFVTVAGSTIQLTVREISRGVALVRGPFNLTPGAARVYRFTGEGIVVSVSVGNSESSGLVTATLSDDGEAQGGDFLAWQPATPIRGAAKGLLYTGPGCVGQLHCTVKTAPNAAAWLLLFDSLTEPAANTAPIAGGVSDAVSAIGDSVNMEDEFEPGVVSFQNGLYAALSTDPTQYVAVAAGAVSLDAKIGV